MINVKNIIVTHIPLSDDGYLPSLDLFDFHIFYDDDNFIGVTIDSSELRFELEDAGLHKIYDIETLAFSTIPNEIKNMVLRYLGLNMSIDEILDIMLDEELDAIRSIYLNSIIYYRTNQEGKEIKGYELSVKHFIELRHKFPQDIVSYDILERENENYETKVKLETYLTEVELKNKFKEFLV
jgi:hypothetical protein